MKHLEQYFSPSVVRIFLHLACAIRRPSHWHWHWRGIQRELPCHHWSITATRTSHSF
jgi:hypothetical protein